MKISKAMSAYLILMFFFVFCTFTALSAEKTKISIQKFDVAKNLDSALGSFLYDILLERMVDSGKYTVVDWEELDRIQKYIADSQPNVSEKDAREQAGNQLGIEMIYIGSLKKVGTQFFINVKVLKLDLSVVDTENKFVKSEDELWDGINKVADQLLGLSKEAEQTSEASQAQNGRLFVETEPKDAKVRILNIKPKFQQGIELEAGSYYIEVSAFNYATQKTWVKLSAGEDKTLTFRLTEATASNVLQQAIGFYTGTAGHVDEEKARMLFLETSEKDDPLANMWVAICYYNGLCGFSENKTLANEKAERVIKQIKSLAIDGNGESMYLLGIAYYYGLAIFQNDSKAVYWYQNAAEKGHANAMVDLGYMYEKGKGITKNDAYAAYWYQKAAEKNHAVGIYNLGVVYENGVGVAKDEIRAISLYRRAANIGYSWARERLKYLGSK